MATAPRPAYAHGEQVLVYPLSTLCLLIFILVVIFGSSESRTVKWVAALTAMTVHVALWILPLTMGILDHLAILLVALLAIPIFVAYAVALGVKGREAIARTPSADSSPSETPRDRPADRS